MASEDVKSLHAALLDAWNRRDASTFATLFLPDGECIGFDGTQMVGPEEIERSLSPIFADHPTARYVSKVRTVRELSPTVFVLRAVVGMVPRGKSELNSAANAVQVLAAVDHEGTLRIASFQNTPAAYHGRPDDVARLTQELTELVSALDEG